MRFGASDGQQPQQGGSGGAAGLARAPSGGVARTGSGALALGALPEGSTALVGEAGLGRRNSGGRLLAGGGSDGEGSVGGSTRGSAGGSVSGGGGSGLPRVASAPKVVRFAEESPVDHFTGLSHSSSVLSAVDEDRVL